MPHRTTQLAEDFRLWEFLQSDVMPELAGYVPTPQEIANVTRLAGFLQKVRSKAKAPMRILSGGRPDTVRRLLDGATFHQVMLERGWNPSPTSQHRFFCAADFDFPRSPSVDLWEVFEHAVRIPKVGQVILYLTEGSLRPRFIHLAIHDFNNPTKGKMNPRLICRGNAAYEPYTGSRVSTRVAEGEDIP